MRSFAGRDILSLKEFERNEFFQVFNVAEKMEVIARARRNVDMLKDLSLIHIYATLGRYDEAITAYQQAIALNPKFAAPHNHLGNVYATLGRYDEAIAAYQQAITLNPKFAAPHRGLGNVYRSIDRYEHAISDLRQATALDPEDWSSQAALADAYRNLGNEDAYLQAVELARPLVVGQSDYNHACFASICGEAKEAIALLQSAFAHEPELRTLALRDPDLDNIRDDSRFQAVMSAA